MKVWRWIGLLVIVAALSAFGWHWVADDPGYVLIRVRGWRVETTVATAVVLAVLIWAVLTGLWRLILWPFGAVSRRHRRVSRERLGAGLVALTEGRHGDAERDLNRAAKLHELRGPALLGVAFAASRRGDPSRALEALDEAGQSAPRAARVVRARVLRQDDKPADALALLTADADSASLSPGGWRELALAALATKDFGRALAALEPLQKSAAFGARDYAALEANVLTAAINAAPDPAALNALWSQLPKNQRRVSAAVEAYARCAAGFGQTLPAIDEVESALRREWSSSLAETWGELGGDNVAARLQRGEEWLATHPNDAGLLLALGRLSLQLQRWDKAQDYLARSLALKPGVGAWEALAESYAGRGDTVLTQRCYRNALAFSRGAAIVALPQDLRSGYPDTRPIAIEERDQHGMPRMRE